MHEKRMYSILAIKDKKEDEKEPIATPPPSPPPTNPPHTNPPSKHARAVLGAGKSVLFREVSSVQGWSYREGFHCVPVFVMKV